MVTSQLLPWSGSLTFMNQGAIGLQFTMIRLLETQEIFATFMVLNRKMCLIALTLHLVSAKQNERC